MKRALGRDYLPDPRDKRFRLQVRRSSRKSRHWPLGECTDQANRPSCVGHAWCSWLAAAPVRQTVMDPDGLYLLSQHYDEWDGNDYEGTSVRGAAKVLKITGHIVEYRWEWDLQRAIDYVLEDGPLVFGTDWYEEMAKPTEDGFIFAEGRLLGGHAYLVYGVDTRRGFASIRNQYGDDWGQNGNARIPLQHLDRLLRADGECCAARERKL